MGMSLAPELTDATATQIYLNLHAGLDEERQDPLKFFRWASKKQARIAYFLSLWLEVLARFGNSAGKTSGVAAIFVALCRGLKVLDGQRLPEMRQPIVHWVLTKTRRQQVDSVQAEYLRWLGNAVHQIAWDNRAKHYIDSIWVATPWCTHGHDAHCHNCSRIVFHCEQSGVQTALGGRVDSCHADEPPDWRIWSEIRSRKKAGRKLLLAITATPLYRKDWEEMARDFHACEEQPRDGRVEIRSSLMDNQFLTDDDRWEFVVKLWGGTFEDGEPKKTDRSDALFEARVWGDYVDASGQCPFPSAYLRRWDKRTFDPILSKTMQIEAERDTEKGIVLEHRKAIVDIWWRREPLESYFVLVDPSTGMEDAKHDPAGIHVYARRKPRLVARYDGYLGAHGVGILAGKLARYYNGALVDVEVTGGYGRGSLQALRRMGYTNLNWRDVELSPGRVIRKLGWDTTGPLRGQFMAGIQRSLEENSIHVPSRAVLSTLRGMIVGPGGKYIAQAGRHDEDGILLGRASYLFMERPESPVRAEEVRVTMAKALERETGRPVIEHPDEKGPRIRLRK